MKYTVKGTYRKRQVELVWKDGCVSGDEVICRLLKIESDCQDIVGPPCGPYTTEDHLSDPLSALFLIGSLINITDVTGDTPVVPDVPEGAIP